MLAVLCATWGPAHRLTRLPAPRVRWVSRETSRVPPGKRDYAIGQRRVAGQLPGRPERHLRAGRGVGAGELREEAPAGLGSPDDGCEHMPVAEFVVRPARAGDARAMAELMATVAQERDGIATEPPVDIEERAAAFARGAAESVVAVASGRIVGMLHVDVSRFGFGELGMLVDRGWRGRGVGSALVQAAIAWARGQRLHKLCLEVFPHNTAAIAVYRKDGYVVEGRRERQYRRASGELWDTIVMGLVL